MQVIGTELGDEMTHRPNVVDRLNLKAGAPQESVVPGRRAIGGSQRILSSTLFDDPLILNKRTVQA
jgi:hypothetical protein